jgi:hypothetical protein
MMRLICLAAVAQAAVVKLATFDRADPTYRLWTVQNDPVMGGQSFSTFTVDKTDHLGVFNGTVAIVPFLKAPGFARVGTPIPAKTFPDVSAFLKGSMQIRLRSSTPGFKGFKLDFGAPGVPQHHGGHEIEGSFKAPFMLKDTTDFQIVEIPMNTFSWDWSDATGLCTSKDADGYQHHCCSEKEPQYCPTEKFLKDINTLQFWAEGAAGNFHVEIDWIGAA